MMMTITAVGRNIWNVGSGKKIGFFWFKYESSIFRVAVVVLILAVGVPAVVIFGGGATGKMLLNSFWSCYLLKVLGQNLRND